MRRLIFSARNLSIQVLSKSEDKSKVAITAEIILAALAGKEYEMNSDGEIHRKDKIEEFRFHCDKESLKNLVNQLGKTLEELEKWDEVDVPGVSDE